MYLIRCLRDFSSVKKIILFIRLCWILVAAQAFFSVVASGDCCLVAVASLVLNNRLVECSGFSSCGTWAVDRRLRTCDSRA